MLLHDTQLPGTLALNQTLHPTPMTRSCQARKRCLAGRWSSLQIPGQERWSTRIATLPFRCAGARQFLTFVVLQEPGFGL